MKTVLHKKCSPNSVQLEKTCRINRQKGTKTIILQCKIFFCGSSWLSRFSLQNFTTELLNQDCLNITYNLQHFHHNFSVAHFVIKNFFLIIFTSLLALFFSELKLNLVKTAVLHVRKKLTKNMFEKSQGLENK